MIRGPLHNRGTDALCGACGEPFPCPTGIAIYEAVKRELEHPTSTETRRQSGTILLFQDDPELIDMLAFALKRAGLESIAAHDGPTALRLFEEQQPGLVVLNIKKFPDGFSGLDVLKKLRQHSQVPIIVLTGMDSEEDKVRALEAGADDYMTRPFSHLELIARIRTQLRRTAR